MRVSGNLQIDRVLGHVVGPVRLMGQQDNRLARGNSAQGQIEIGFSVQNVIHAREPESVALTFQRNGPVAQDRNSVGLQDSGHVGRIRAYIMVSQDRENSGMGAQLGEQLRRRARWLSRQLSLPAWCCGGGDRATGEVTKSPVSTTRSGCSG